MDVLTPCKKGPLIVFTANDVDAGRRLDTVLATRLEATSRSFATKMIREGHVLVNGLSKKAGHVVKKDDVIRSGIPAPRPIACEPQPIPLSILFEDFDIIVVDKPAGLVVHPAAGHESGTMVNALLHYCQDLQGIGGEIRPGIVHRLDKDTSGCLVAAKNDMAHQALVQQFKKREVQKRYLALVYGGTKAKNGTIDLPIGRHPINRKKMSTKSRKTRSTMTHWKIKEVLPGISFLEIDLKTGRTHQIRVHCASMGHPVLGDPTYGGRKKWKNASPGIQNIVRSVKRQMLHAWKLGFTHPRTGKPARFESPMPQDMATVLEKLRLFASPG
jgi:23S rRNA pseudouridine1911/1915/1917 synthase